MFSYVPVQDENFQGLFELGIGFTEQAFTLLHVGWENHLGEFLVKTFEFEALAIDVLIIDWLNGSLFFDSVHSMFQDVRNDLTELEL